MSTYELYKHLIRDPDLNKISTVTADDNISWTAGAADKSVFSILYVAARSLVLHVRAAYPAALHTMQASCMSHEWAACMP